METHKSLLTQQKFTAYEGMIPTSFYLTDKHPGCITHPQLAMPQCPLLGKYNNSEYQFLEILSVVNFGVVNNSGALIKELPEEMQELLRGLPGNVCMKRKLHQNEVNKRKREEKSKQRKLITE